MAVDEGNEFGDEYQADLDYIECVENGKEGYESDVEEPSDIEEDAGNLGELEDLIGYSVVLVRDQQGSRKAHFSKDFGKMDPFTC